MIRFCSDYQEGACEKIMQRLAGTNLEQTCGYGEDAYCVQARNRIRRMTGQPEVAVHFLVGGTQVNTIVIAAALRPHQGVLCAQSGHINVHETGAVEATGHKVLALPAVNGKITAAQVKGAVDAHSADASREHIVQPKMVYISFPTELGTLYTENELSELYRVCRENGLYLYIDGARLGYGLTSEACDMDIKRLAACCDAFTIGGTKCGALFGEALVLTNQALHEDFRYIIKQRGGMLAKGRLLGVQFLALLEDDTYFAICKKAVGQAVRIKAALGEMHVPFLLDSPTNQQFPILPRVAVEKLSDRFAFEPWQQMDNARVAVRICTSWATKDEDVDALLSALSQVC